MDSVKMAMALRQLLSIKSDSSNNVYAAFFIIVAEDNVLCTVELGRDRVVPKWGFPGGKKNAGEGNWDCATRELKEELGVEMSRKFQFLHAFILNGCKYFVVSKDHVDTRGFKVNREVVGYAFISISTVVRAIKTKEVVRATVHNGLRRVQCDYQFRHILCGPKSLGGVL